MQYLINFLNIDNDKVLTITRLLF